MIDYERIDDFSWDEEETTTEFIINSDNLANWAVKKIKEAQDEHDRLVAIAKAEIEKRNLQIEKLDEQLENKTSFLKGKLYEYFNNVEHKSTKTQESYKLLDGSLVWKKPTTKIVKGNDEAWDSALLFYLEESQPELIEVVKKPLWGEFKKNLAINNGQVVDMATGEVLDFIKTEEDTGKFDIKF